MQQKNVIVFIVLCFVVFVGWTWLQRELWPQPDKKQDQKKTAKDEKKPPPRPMSSETLKENKLKLPLAFDIIGSGALPGNALGVAVKRAQLAKAEFFLNREETSKSPAAIAALLANPTPAGVAVFLRSPGAPRFRPPEQDTTDVDLSDKDFFLQVRLTTRGAGVRRLRLPKFQAADELGLPVFTQTGGKREPVPLDLIPDDGIRPSFRMFHYPHPSATDPNKRFSPSTALGEAIWQLESPRARKNAQGENEVTFTLDHVPGYEGVKIRKTYTLGPRDYHVGVRLEISYQRVKEGEKFKPFRYQFSGAHALPVEGEWYASVTRHPMVGLVTNAGSPWRDLSETQHLVAFRNGGEPIPPQRGDSSVQWAGVANQYFSCLIVVDDKQEGSLQPRDVVDYTRATRESTEELAVYQGKGPARDAPGDFDLEVLGRLGAPGRFRLLPEAAKNIDARKIKPGDPVLVNYYTVHKPGQAEPMRVATGVRPGRVPRPQLDDITVRVVSNELFAEGRAPIVKGDSLVVVHKYLLYNGPVKVSLLGQFTGDKAVKPATVDRYESTLNLDTMTDYHSPGWIGSFASTIGWTWLIVQFTRLMHWLLHILHFIVPSYGLSIILLTLIVRGLMFPISRRQAVLSIKMQELGPEMKKLQEKYKHDPTKRNQAVMELYRKHGVNPLGGCLTLLLQMPVFMGLYYALQESVHFRLAGFLWIDNLAAPDMLFWWSESIPLISDPDNMGGFGYLGPFFNLLPVFAVVLMLVQQKLMTPPPADEQQAMQQKMFKFMMIIFGFLFYKLAAGLCLYFIVSSLWGLAERRFLPKRPTAAAPGGGPGKGPGGGGGGGGGGPGRGPGGGGRGKGRPGKKGKEPEGAIGRVRSWWQEVLKQAKKE
jgi:YidC/Oxa1 family membrane protein insertase